MVSEGTMVSVEGGDQATICFEKALDHARDGMRIHRVGWSGKGMFCFIIKEWTYTDGKQDNYPNLPFIAMKTADNTVVPWLASQTDLLATDWLVS